MCLQKDKYYKMCNNYYCIVIKDCFNDCEVEDILENDFLNKS